MIREDSTNDVPSKTAYERAATEIRQIDAYFDDPGYSKAKTKDDAVFFSGGGEPSQNGFRYYANMVKFYVI